MTTEAGDEDRTQRIRILTGDPTAEELAAVTAVLSVALEHLAEEERIDTTPPSTWERRRRPLREPLVSGGWSTFGR